MVGVRSRDNTGGCLFAWHTAEPIYARSSSSSSNFPLDHMELWGGGGWARPGRQTSHPQWGRYMRVQPVPAWGCRRCSQPGMGQLSRAWRQGVGWVLRVQVPRKLRWPQGSHQDPRSPGAPAPPIIHPQALKGGARLSLQVTLLYGPELGGHHARPASSVEAVTYERTQCEAHSLMAVTGLGEPRRVSLRRLQLGGHVAHCEARGLFFELLEKKKKKLISFSSFPTCLGLPCCPLAGS